MTEIELILFKDFIKETIRTTVNEAVEKEFSKIKKDLKEIKLLNAAIIKENRQRAETPYSQNNTSLTENTHNRLVNFATGKGKYAAEPERLRALKNSIIGDDTLSSSTQSPSMPVFVPDKKVEAVTNAVSENLGIKTNISALNDVLSQTSIDMLYDPRGSSGYGVGSEMW